MKGIVFTEFLDFVEEVFDADTVDHIIETSDLESEGVYTSVGSYDFQEMVQLVTSLSKKTDTPVPKLLFLFGEALMGRFITLYPQFFSDDTNLLDFIDGVDNHIHVEVWKLYPDAELPKFTTIEKTPERIVLDYESCRALGSLAEGLITGAANHFEEDITVSSETLGDQSGQKIRFTIELDSADKSQAKVA